MTSRFCPGSFRHTSISSRRISIHQWRGGAATLGDAPEIEAQNKFLRRNIFPIDVLAYSPYQQLQIEIVGTNQPLGPHLSPHSAIMLIIGRNASPAAVSV